MTINEYQQAALRTANGGKCVDVVNGVLGLTGESGECADIVKKHKFQGHDLNVDKLWKRYPEGFDAERSLHREVGDE